MNETVSLRWAAAALRRQSMVLAMIMLLGAMLGVGLAVLRPASYSSNTLVLLPANEDPNAQQDSAPSVATQVGLATSTTVLGAAGDQMTPRMTYQQVKKRVSAEAATDRLLKFTATMPTAAQAQSLVAAATDSYVKYVQANLQAANTTALADLNARRGTLSKQIAAVDVEIKKSVARQQAAGATPATVLTEAQLQATLQAQQADLVVQKDRVDERLVTAASTDGSATLGVTVAQPASPPTTMAPALWRALWGLVGALAAGLTGAVAILLRARRDKRLRLRDQVAGAVGSPVLAAVASRSQSTARGWFSLMKSYRPPSVDAWAMRQVLRTAAEVSGVERPRMVVLVSLTGDERGLSIGPMLASFSAATGTPTRFLLGAGRQRAATLWTAMSGAQDLQPRPGLVIGEDRGTHHPADLIVVQHVLDRHAPLLDRIDHRVCVMLAVSAGNATEVELARLALAVDAAGGQITGVLLGDPDSGDHTSGRRSLSESSRTVAAPSRLTGLAAPANRRS